MDVSKAIDEGKPAKPEKPGGEAEVEGDAAVPRVPVGFLPRGAAADRGIFISPQTASEPEELWSSQRTAKEDTPEHAEAHLRQPCTSRQGLGSHPRGAEMGREMTASSQSGGLEEPPAAHLVPGDRVATSSHITEEGHPDRRVARTMPQRAFIADREVSEGPPGTIHPSHHAMQTDTYTFCCLCGVFGKQLRRCALHLRCPREPRNRIARTARDKLMSGFEPNGRGWGNWRRCEGPVRLLDDD